MTTHDELRALAMNATAGPWETEALFGHPDFISDGSVVVARTLGAGGQLAHDAAYIAAVSPDVVVGLLDEIAELRAAHAKAVDELRLWGAATVTQADTGHGRARLGGAA